MRSHMARYSVAPSGFTAPGLNAFGAGIWTSARAPGARHVRHGAHVKCARREVDMARKKRVSPKQKTACARRKILSRYGDKRVMKRWDFSTFTTTRSVRALSGAITVLCFCVRVGYYRTPSSHLPYLNRERHACIAPAYLLTILNDLPGAAPGESLPALPLFLPVVSSHYFFGAHHDALHPESGPA